MKISRLARWCSLFTTMVLLVATLGGCVNSEPTANNSGDGGASTGDASTAPVNEVDTSEGVKVGFIWPLTGGSATIGQQHDDGARWAIEEINANGGIKSMGGIPIIPVVADSETQPDVGANHVERLATNEGCAIIVGCYNSAVTFPAAEVAERYNVPFISQGGVKNEITERGYEWVFRVNNKADYDVREMLMGLDMLEEETGQTVQTYALIYESTDWGSDNARIWKEYADERGWECVLDEPVTVGQADMSSQIAKIRAANPDVINVSFYTDEMIVFAKALTANEINPPLGVWSVGGGSQDPAFFEAVDAVDYEYHFVQEDWNVSGVLNYEWITELDAQVYAEKGYHLNSFFAQGWTAAYVAYEALEAAGSANNGDIQAALRDLNIEFSTTGESRVLLSGYPRIQFDENGQNTFSTGTIIQYQNGIAVGLYPEIARAPGAEFIAPIPDDWDTRGEGAAPWGTMPDAG